MALRRTLLAFSILALALSGCAFPVQGTDTPDMIGGNYYLNGTTPAGHSYSGRLTIIATEDPDVFTLQWIITGFILQGVGEFDGTTLTATWETLSPPDDTTGTIVFTLQSDGSLIGERRVDGHEGVGHEEAFPVPG